MVGCASQRSWQFGKTCFPPLVLRCSSGGCVHEEGKGGGPREFQSDMVLEAMGPTIPDSRITHEAVARCLQIDVCAGSDWLAAFDAGALRGDFQAGRADGTIVRLPANLVSAL